MEIEAEDKNPAFKIKNLEKDPEDELVAKIDREETPTTKKVEEISKEVLPDNNDREKLRKLVTRHEKQNPELGEILCVEHLIKTENLQLSPVRTYRVPYNLRTAVKEELDRLLRQGVIRRSTAETMSPAFLVKKKNGQIRIVVDFRNINRATKSSSYPCQT